MNSSLHEVIEAPQLLEKIIFIRDLISECIEKSVLQKVYLFGSYAYGNPDEDSDVDLCVVINDNADKMKVYMDISLKLIDNNILNFDLLVYRNKIFNESIKKDGVEKIILNKGKLLYA